jgi:hypothetical protein
MSCQKISMIMSQDNVLQLRSSIFYELSEDIEVKGWVNEIRLILGFYIVRVNGQIIGFKLGNVNTFRLLLSNKVCFDIHGLLMLAIIRFKWDKIPFDYNNLDKG